MIVSVPIANAVTNEMTDFDLVDDLLLRRKRIVEGEDLNLSADPALR